MSKKLRRWELASFLFAAIAGPLLHFTYQWSGENPIVAAFSAVNESTWEHMKLLFMPMFLFSLAEMAVLTEQYRNFLAVKAASILLGLLLIPTLYYTYTGIWGQSRPYLDIAVFYIALAVSHWLGLRLLQRGKLVQSHQEDYQDQLDPVSLLLTHPLNCKPCDLVHLCYMQ